MIEQKQRALAQSVAREMTARGMSKSDVHKELKTLELHHAITPEELQQIVRERARPWHWWIPSWTLSRRLVGAFLIPACLIVAVSSFRVLAEQYDQNFMGWSDAENLLGARIGKDFLVASIGLLTGLILALKPRSDEYASL